MAMHFIVCGPNFPSFLTQTIIDRLRMNHSVFSDETHKDSNFFSNTVDTKLIKFIDNICPSYAIIRLARIRFARNLL